MSLKKNGEPLPIVSKIDRMAVRTRRVLAGETEAWGRADFSQGLVHRENLDWELMFSFMVPHPLRHKAYYRGNIRWTVPTFIKIRMLRLGDGR